MAALLDLEHFDLKNTGDLVQQTAAFLWLHKGDEYKDLYKKVTGLRVANELFHRITQKDDIEQLQAQCIRDVADYVKKHPKATESELVREITKLVKEFKAKVESS